MSELNNALQEANYGLEEVQNTITIDHGIDAIAADIANRTLIPVGTAVQVMSSEHNLLGRIAGYGTFQSNRYTECTYPVYMVELEQSSCFWSERRSDTYQSFVSVLAVHEDSLEVLS